MTAPPYTPEMLAERWHCTANYVRARVREGKLSAFYIGKFIRIPAAAVEEYECRETRNSSGTEASGQSDTTTLRDDATVRRLARGIDVTGSPPRPTLVNG